MCETCPSHIRFIFFHKTTCATIGFIAVGRIDLSKSDRSLVGPRERKPFLYKATTTKISTAHNELGNTPPRVKQHHVEALKDVGPETGATSLRASTFKRGATRAEGGWGERIRGVDRVIFRESTGRTHQPQQPQERPGRQPRHYRN